MEQFRKDYTQIVTGVASEDTVARAKNYLKSLNEANRKELRIKSTLSTKAIASVQELELFKLLVDVLVTDHDLKVLVIELVQTRNRKKHYESLLERLKKIYENDPIVADFIGSDLEKLRLEALSFLSTTNKDECKVYIDDYQNLREVVEYGFIPSFELYNDYRQPVIGSVELVLEHIDVPFPTLEYVYYKRLPKSFHLFTMLTEEGANRIYKKNNEKSTSMLRWTYPHLAYSSQRIKTSMSMFIEHSLHSIRCNY